MNVCQQDIKRFCSIQVTYTNWLPGEPNVRQERCGAQQVRNFIMSVDKLSVILIVYLMSFFVSKAAL